MTLEYTRNMLDSTSLELAKIGKILALIDEGNIHEAIGKSLNEVEVDAG